MDKDKINIDQFFKKPLQNFEGNADDAMFGAIKEKVDASLDNDVPKVSVDNFFKEAILGFEGNADDGMFDSIKKKVDASKVSVDNYFKDALLDYNSDAGSVPFTHIQNKLDRERVIDDHFKNALQNFEGNARDGEFAVIRKRVLELQESRNRRRYAWILLLLLIPAWFLGTKYFGGNNGNLTNSTTVNSTSDKSVNNNNSSKLSDNNSPKVNSNSGSENNSHQAQNSVASTSSVNNRNGNNNNSSLPNKENNNSKNSSDPVVAEGSNKANKENPDKNSTDVTKGDNKEGNSVEENKTEVADTKVKDANVPAVVKPEEIKKTAKTNIRTPKYNYTVQVFGAASMNSRYLNADKPSSHYLATRNASDKVTTKYNFGVDVLQQVGKFNFGIGLHQDQYGQSGSYHLTKELSDSFPVLGPPPLYQIKGYIHINYRDTSFAVNYNNTFSTFEIPVQFSYRICKASKVEVEVGMGISLSYLTGFKGALPNANSSDVVQLKDMMSSINRFGSAGTASMKVNYMLTPRWQLGTSLYLKSNITSVYKNATGVKEIPYSAGMRLGLGYKF